jgi:hypothetical protein
MAVPSTVTTVAIAVGASTTRPSSRPASAPAVGA